MILFSYREFDEDYDHPCAKKFASTADSTKEKRLVCFSLTTPFYMNKAPNVYVAKTFTAGHELGPAAYLLLAITFPGDVILTLQ